jgi:hypothetical protein
VKTGSARSEGWWGFAHLFSVLFTALAVAVCAYWMLSLAADTLYLPGLVQVYLAGFIGLSVAKPIGNRIYLRTRRHFDPRTAPEDSPTDSG